MQKWIWAGIAALFGVLLPSSALAAWHKCQLHAHSNRSRDATHFPEAVAGIYYNFGFKCLVLSEHNTFTGEYWIAGTGQERTSYDQVLPGRRETSDAGLTRVPSFEETKAFVESTFMGFKLIGGIELTQGRPVNVHLNVFGSVDGGMNVIDAGNPAATITANVAAARALSIQVIQLNHINFRWAVAIDDFKNADLNLIEVWNTHMYGRNDGDATHPATDIAWDTANAHRVAVGLPLIYGTATDDAHYYFDNLTLTFSPNLPNNGWVQIWTTNESPSEQELLDALKAGDFYASTGVELTTVTAQHGCQTVVSSNPDDVLEAYAVSPAGMTYIIDSAKGQIEVCPDRCFAFGRVRVTSANGARAWTQPVLTTPN